MLNTQDRAIGLTMQLRALMIDVKDAEKEYGKIRQDKTFRFLPNDRMKAQVLKEEIIKILENIKV